MRTADRSTEWSVAGHRPIAPRRVPHPLAHGRGIEQSCHEGAAVSGAEHDELVLFARGSRALPAAPHESSDLGHAWVLTSSLL